MADQLREISSQLLGIVKHPDSGAHMQLRPHQMDSHSYGNSFHPS